VYGPNLKRNVICIKTVHRSTFGALDYEYRSPLLKNPWNDDHKKIQKYVTCKKSCQNNVPHFPFENNCQFYMSLYKCFGEKEKAKRNYKDLYKKNDITKFLVRKNVKVVDLSYLSKRHSLFFPLLSFYA